MAVVTGPRRSVASWVTLPGLARMRRWPTQWATGTCQTAYR
jgi:hypothetical protein